MKRFLVFLCILFCLAGCSIQTVEQYQQQSLEEMGITVENGASSQDISGISPQATGQAATDGNINEDLTEEDKDSNRLDEKKVELSDEEAQLAVTENNTEHAVGKQGKQDQVTSEASEGLVVQNNNESKSVAANANSKDANEQVNVADSKDSADSSGSKHDTNHSSKNTSLPAETDVQPKHYVTIGIYVKTLLKEEHRALLHPSLQGDKYIPEDGVILNTTKYELLSEKETVWDILLRAAKQYNIQLEYQGANNNVYNSVYVEGIQYLYEFSAGELSGWMYSVNGTYPQVGASQYVLKNNDAIEWHYTVDLGKDLGQEWVSE